MGKSGKRMTWKIIKGCDIKRISKRGRDTIVKMSCSKKSLDKILK
jgi:hypothetical protein